MWSLYKNGEFLEPLRFSNGKTQEDVVEEVLREINHGQKIIFIHGVCGTGKSAIALNIARKIGKTSIVVPGKNLQNQYKRDYEKEKYLLKDNGEKLKISVLTGRRNHKCKFLEDNKDGIPKVVKEINSKLNDIFDGKREKFEEDYGKDFSADNDSLPCKIEIREKNWRKISEYLKQNKRVNWRDFSEIKDVKRNSIAPVCPYWSPVIPNKYELKMFNANQKRVYRGLAGMDFAIYSGKPGCTFYEQYHSYIDSDVIVFNSQKYKLEFALNRKPLTEVDIIDECDEFLDSFANQKNLSIDRLASSLVNNLGINEKLDEIIEEISTILREVKQNPRVLDSTVSQKIIPLKETGIYDLLKILLKNKDLVYEVDEESYFADALEIALNFENSFDESYISFEKKENFLTANIVTTNLEKKFNELVHKNKVLVLMSGTLHSEEVLKNIFGIKNFKIVEAEVMQQGQMKSLKTSQEMNCSYNSFSNQKTARKNYLEVLDKCVELSEKPALVHINAFQDLPTDEELELFDLKNLISRNNLIEDQSEDTEGKIILDFKEGKTKVLFTTRCARGVDFPGDECRSIIFTKYPNPNIQDSFWKVLKETKPQFYWDFYKDKARRELLQKIYRGLRSKDDWVFVLSPDIRIFDYIERSL